MEVGVIRQQQQLRIEQIDHADLLVGLLADLDPDRMSTMFESLRAIPGSPRIVVLQNRVAADSAPAASDVSEKDALLSLVPWNFSVPESSTEPLLSLSAAYKSIFTLGQKLGARACCLITSQLADSTSHWIGQLALPLFEGDSDLVLPNYAPRKFDGLLNASIIYPLTRALYGKRILHPMGPDMGVSKKLSEKVLGTSFNSASAKQTRSLESWVPTAVCSNMKVCEVNVGSRVRPPSDWTNVSSILAQVLGPVFAEVERNAACWQHARSSLAVPSFGQRTYPEENSGTVDFARLVNSFQLGARELQEIWGLVLPPATLFQLRKCSTLPAEQFVLPDELWARIIYDFALAHRLQTINRAHLLRSLTPLYLGWVASYAREVEKGDTRQAEQRIERLSLAYEVGKTYFVSRWRWPDRFNP